MQTQFNYRSHRVELRQTGGAFSEGGIFVISIDGFDQRPDDPTERGLPLRESINAAKKMIDWLEDTKDQVLGKPVAKPMAKDEDPEPLPF